MENPFRISLNKAVKELEVGLLELDNPTYKNIDKLMRNIMKKYDLTAKELHYGFKSAHDNQTPDDWIKGERKMKTFREFIEEAYSILDEDASSYARRQATKKARGREGKTPLYVDKTIKSVEKTPEGKWKVKKTTEKKMNPKASVGKFKQNPTNLPSVQGGGHGGSGFGYGPHPHGTGGVSRGKKKGEQPKEQTPTRNKFQRRADLSRAKHYRKGGDVLYSGLIGDRAAKRLRDKAQKSFAAASKDWDKK